MISNSTPYTQKALIPDLLIEEAYKTINVWLRYNNWSVTREENPTQLEAKYSGDIQMFQIGPRDSFPKTMNVRLTEFGGDVLLNIDINQTMDRMGDKGYIYWGIMLQDLYEMLGVKITENTISDLIPERMLSKIIKARYRLLTGFLLVSVIASWFLWESFRNLGEMYRMVFIVPIGLITIWDLQAYRGLTDKMRKRHKLR
ncbi:hypothetical protein MUP51_09485 [Candidatus Bathyarchaeota archaeon]|nr:hypothetical protein [Candidatus Bathyarchaeota archaeon]